jgi:phosphoglycolate phosphatase-like HAD superfamily hydrolase
LIEQLDDLSLLDLFAEVRCRSEEPEATKTDLLRNVHKGSGTVIGDSEADVEAARELGLTSICVTTGVRSRRFLEALGADEIIPSVTQLPAALSALGAEQAALR